MRWLRLSVVMNMVLAGALIGLIFSALLGSAHLSLPPVRDGQMMERLLAQIIDETLDGDSRARALAVLQDRRAAFDADVARIIGGVDGADWPEMSRERMAAAFVAGDLTDELVAQWQSTLSVVSGAQWRFISGVFLDLSRTLNQEERTRLRDAMADRASRLREAVRDQTTGTPVSDN